MLINNHFNKYNSFYLILFFFVIHLSFLNTPFVNYEWIYRMGSQAIVTSNYNLLTLYFNNQANPITYSFLSSLPLILFGDHYATYRILSLIGGTLLLILLTRHKKPFLILIVGLNPLIWIYSGRAFSEMLSVGVMMLALETNRNGVLKGILVTFSSVIKYHSIVVCVSYWFLRWLDNLIKYKSISWQDKNLLAGIISICGLFSFFLIYYQEHGVWIIPDQFKKEYTFTFLNMISNILSYSFYLGGMFFLTIPFHLRNTTWRWQLVVILMILPLIIFYQSLGEMGFGSFNNVFGPILIFLIKLFGIWNFIFCILHFSKYDESRMMLITVVIYIVILSLTKPAQRYLIFVIPFWAIMICKHFDMEKIFKWGYVGILIAVNFFATIYQINSGTAYEKIAFWVQKNNISFNSKGKGIDPHHFGIYPFHNSASKIYISPSAEPGKELLIKQSVSILGYPVKTYYVLKDSGINE